MFLVSPQIMSLHLRYISFLWQIADLGCTLNMPLLRDGARVLMKLMPPGTNRDDSPCNVPSGDGLLKCAACVHRHHYSGEPPSDMSGSR